LLFCSKGFSGYGDYDIFCSYRLDDTWKNWSEPINLGNIINSSAYEGSPAYDEASETLYFTSIAEGASKVRFVKIPKYFFQKSSKN
jgi:hypothetical protein